MRLKTTRKSIQCGICGAKFSPGDAAIGPHRERHRLEEENLHLRTENARLARLIVSLGGKVPA